MSLRWSRGLLEDDRVDPLLCQCKGQHGPASTGSNYGNVGFFNHDSSAISRTSTAPPHLGPTQVVPPYLQHSDYFHSWNRA